jgi:ZIP family zinc transporter
MIVFLAFASFISTLLGGLVALKNKDNMHRILGFTAGVLLGVVAFDVLPEIFSIVHEQSFSASTAMVALVVGFLAFHILEKSLILHHAHEHEYGLHKHPQVGLAAALALSGHSFLDGVGIGLGFQVSTAVGVTVAIAVIAHDFADGLNTVSLMLTHKNSRKNALKLLILDATAPILGVASTMLFHVGDFGLMLYLGVFAGFLLYIGASDILPEAHAKHPSRQTLFFTVFGTGFIYVVTRFI